MVYHVVCQNTRKITMKLPPTEGEDVFARLKMIGTFNKWRDSYLPHIIDFGLVMDFPDEEIEVWIIENLTEKWSAGTLPSAKYFFENSFDAVAFKMQWG